MNTMLTILGMQVQAARNTVRNDARMKVAVGVMLLIDVGVALWGVPQLQASIRQWRVQGVTEQHLLLFCLFTCFGITFLTIVESMHMLGNDEALVLFMLPLAPASRFRVLYGSLLLQGLWNWMLLEAVVSSSALFPLLGWQTLAWIALLELSAMVAVLGGFIVVLLVLRYLFAGRGWTLWLWTLLAFGALMVVIVVSLFSQRTQTLPIPIFWFHPEPYVVLCSIFLLIVLGPLAGLAGSLYMQAFLVTQRWNCSRRVLMLPGIRVLVNALANRRTLISALFTKMLLNQSRNPFVWLRFGVTLLALLLFVPLHALAQRVGWSNTVFVAIYTASLGILPVVEQAPCAIGGEANRLTLYLSAPLNMAQLLHAKLVQFLLPAAGIGLLSGLFYSWQLHLMLLQIAIALSAMLLMIIGTLVVLVWGSIWDEDLNLAVEGTLQMILQEEGPMTPRRMGLFNLGVATFAVMVFLLWQLEPIMALPILTVLDVGLLLGMERLGCVKLRKLVG